MTDVIAIEGRTKRTALDAYDDLTLKLGHFRAIATLISAADSGRMTVEEMNIVGYGLERMFDEIRVGVDELWKLGGAK